MATTVSPKDLTGFEDIVKATANTTKTGTQKTLGKEDFLKMLLAQMKNQDPLNPQDGTAFAAQLAQFSSLEQLTNLNAEIQNQSLSMTTLAHTQAVGLIGKTVNVTDGNSLVAAGQPLDISYTLAEDAKNVQVTVFDQEGKLVKTIEGTDQEAGQNRVTWNMDADTTGNYTFQVSARDINGNDITVNPMSQGTVEAVRFKDNKIYVLVNGQELLFSNVTTVSQKT